MGNENLARIGAELRRYRRRAKLTQRKLGEMVGRTGQSISGYELGDEAPAPDIVEALDRALEADGELLRLYGLMPQEDAVRILRQLAAIADRLSALERQGVDRDRRLAALERSSDDAPPPAPQSPRR